MSFFKNIFKRKPGGSFFGNIIRGVASSATNGILGSGAGLARWEAKEQEKLYNQEAIKQTNATLQNNAAFKAGQSAGAAATESAPADPEAEKFVKRNLLWAFLKKHWWKILIPAVGLPLLIILIVRASRRSRKNKKKGR